MYTHYFIWSSLPPSKACIILLFSSFYRWTLKSSESLSDVCSTQLHNSCGMTDLLRREERSGDRRVALTCSCLPPHLSVYYVDWFRDCLPCDSVCFLRADTCLYFSSPCSHHSISVQYSVNVSWVCVTMNEWTGEWMNELMKGITEISKLQRLDFDSFLRASIFSSDILITQRGVSEFLYFCRFLSPLQSSRTTAWKSMFKTKGKEKPVCLLDSL